MTEQRAKAFLAALTKLCREHEVVIRCSGYECDGLDLDHMDACDQDYSYQPYQIHWDEHTKLFCWKKERRS